MFQPFPKEVSVLRRPRLKSVWRTRLQYSRQLNHNHDLGGTTHFTFCRLIGSAQSSETQKRTTQFPRWVQFGVGISWSCINETDVHNVLHQCTEWMTRRTTEIIVQIDIHKVGLF